MDGFNTLSSADGGRKTAILVISSNMEVQRGFPFSIVCDYILRVLSSLYVLIMYSMAIY